MNCRKVFKKLGFEVSDDVIHNVTSCKPSAIEQFLLLLREKLEHVSVSTLTQISSPPNSGTGQRCDHHAPQSSGNNVAGKFNFYARK